MLTAGDEFGRSQGGNNNAYAQDNRTSWIDWGTRDGDLEDHVAGLSAWRSARLDRFGAWPAAGTWTDLDGHPMTAAKWEDPSTHGVLFQSHDPDRRGGLKIDRMSGVAECRDT
jgi:glycogen debranching enzyme